MLFDGKDLTQWTQTARGVFFSAARDCFPAARLAPRRNNRLMKLLLLAVALPMFAADPAGFQMWTSSELQTRANALKLNEYQQGVDRMENWGNHAVILERLEGATPAEAHETMADLFVVTSGETALTVGGVIADPVNTSAGEIRGKSINGGVAKRLAAGDIVHIPAKMPHQLSVEAGKRCTYLVFKVRME